MLYIDRNFESTCSVRYDTRKYQCNFHYREMTEKRSKIEKKTALEASEVAYFASIPLVFLLN